MMRIIASVLLVVGFLSSALPAVAGEMDAKAKMLAKLDDDWSKAAVARDVERVASYYAEDAIAYAPDMPIAKGRPAAKKVWAAYFADTTFAISWTTVHAEVAASGDIGYTAGTYEDSLTGPDGKRVVEKGKYLCVWKKMKDGTWKATHDMWNGDGR
jgi:ketosteroid isomerase-like protein